MAPEPIIDLADNRKSGSRQNETDHDPTSIRQHNTLMSPKFRESSYKVIDGLADQVGE